ncbi:MAG: type IV secretory system conjugative DNA transfer family protein [Clostridiales bacterium]|jgi:type IV secretion system protein VirD4|nr:type IV secretory system conjugative DNA transfer family protein [Clostridiales bacterium]
MSFSKRLDSVDLKKIIIALVPPLSIAIMTNLLFCTSRVYFAGNILSAIGYLFSYPKFILNSAPLSLNGSDLAAGLVGGAATALIILEARSGRKNFKPGIEHGSAKWGTRKNIIPYMDPVFRNNIILSKTEMIALDSRPKDWTKARNKNILVVGGSGSGKTRNFIKPNIMQMHSSYVITDPKGTMLNELGCMLLKHKYKVKVFDLIDMSQSMKYNPFSYIKEPEDILKLVETIISNTNGDGPPGNEDFWTKAEKLLYQALIGGIFYEFFEGEKNFASLVKVLALMEVREEDETHQNLVDVWFKKREEDIREFLADSAKSASEKKMRRNALYAIEQYKAYKLAAGKTAKSILISCAARLSAFNIPKVRDLTRYDELELEKIGSEKTALFIIIPDTDKTFNFLASIMYTQLFNTLCTIADKKNGGRLKIHVRCMLDEFANIGKIPRFENLIATMRSREISASIVVQTKSQLKAIYKDNWEVILGNCDTQLFLGGQEMGTLKDIAESLGKQTIDSRTSSESRGQNSSKGTNYSKLGRELMNISELSRMDRRKCIIQLSGEPPFYSDKFDIETHPMYKYHADSIEDEKWFDAESFLRARFNKKLEIFGSESFDEDKCAYIETYFADPEKKED